MVRPLAVEDFPEEVRAVVAGDVDVLPDESVETFAEDEVFKVVVGDALVVVVLSFVVIADVS